MRSAAAWIEANRSQPFFAWIHLFDPHSPYAPPAPFAAAHRDAPYDGEVAYTDAASGRFLDRLQQQGLYAPATIIIVADHGESLGEHGERTHGTFLYDATIRVPLLIKLPTVRLKPDATYDRAGARTHGAGVESWTCPSRPRTSRRRSRCWRAPRSPAAMARVCAAHRRRDGRSGPAGLHRVLLSEHTARMEPAASGPDRAMEARRSAATRAVRPRTRSVRAAESPERAGGARHRAPARVDQPRRRRPLKDGARAAATSESVERLRSLGYASGSTTPTPPRGPSIRKIGCRLAEIEDGIDLTARDPASARQKFAHALQLQPDNGLAMKYLADLQFRAGRLREAREQYRRAIAAGFRHPDAYVNLASIAEREGHLDEAREALTNAVGLAASDADAWNRSASSKRATVMSTPRGARSRKRLPWPAIDPSRITTSG